MLTVNEYIFAWAVYLAAVLGACAVWWRITRGIPVRWLQNCIRVLFFGLLVAPCMVVHGNERLAPAIMIWALESTIIDVVNPSRVDRPLAIAAVLSLLVAFGEAFISRKLKQKKLASDQG